MTVQQLLQWQAFISQAVALGVRSWAVIKAAMTDAGVADDDAQLAELAAKWDVLVADISRAAGN